jgi:hypothetical protein
VQKKTAPPAPRLKFAAAPKLPAGPRPAAGAGDWTEF